ncbi:MFS general substrate transporter [Coniophora puteana RWD-64-598 SS2]|uniref:MFS general substrate transporter n=1 Tax=Coniophora puteana (strain RWD-64-598) TaxID=741705 RepID=A0A5M3MBQ3_CONPW|nr:MFS general substrate transporter [Coniophora puteana RWD-64-598 SS2]EIW76669.1 MFS general substrate transporter [Coniophora puteana RWD-64-598 SS2]
MSLDRSPPGAEHTPLLSRATRSRSVSKERTFSPTARILPIAIAWQLASLLPVTTTLDVVQRIVCTIWYIRNDPDQIPDTGSIPVELCKNPAVSQNLSAIITVGSLFNGICAILGYSVVTLVSQRIGRKPVILVLLALGVVTNVCVVVVRFLPATLAIVCFTLWAVLGAFVNPLVVSLVINMYVVDVVNAEDRTTALSTLHGGLALGAAFSLTAGGLITTLTHQPSYVYIISIVLLVLSSAYTFFLLPESFTVEKRSELARERELAQLASASSMLSAENRTLKMRVNIIGQAAVSPLAALAEPLRQFKPMKQLQSGRRNWRLVWCGVYAFVESIGDGYVATALIVYLTGVAGYTPAQNGYALTMMLISGAIVMAAVIPFILTYLRPFYARHLPKRFASPIDGTARYGSATEGENATVAAVSGDDVTVSATSDRLDVHLVMASAFFDALGYVSFAAARSLPGHLAAIIAIGFGAGRAPAFRSLVVASVDPLKTGEALAAIEMVSRVGGFLSTLVLGSISTATISTVPQTVFYVHAAIGVLAASILLLIRDRDRWVTPSEGEQ